MNDNKQRQIDLIRDEIAQKQADLAVWMQEEKEAADYDSENRAHEMAQDLIYDLWVLDMQLSELEGTNG